MFTKQDKIKEIVIFFAKSPDVSCLIHKNNRFPAVGASVVMTYKYSLNGLEVIYNKWFVENFNTAKQLKLAGCEHHNQLVKGSGVLVYSEKYGVINFYGKNAQDIINACEEGRDIKSYIIGNQTIKAR